MRVEGRRFLIHALTPASCESIVDGSMVRVVARVFDEANRKAERMKPYSISLTLLAKPTLFPIAPRRRVAIGRQRFG